MGQPMPLPVTPVVTGESYAAMNGTPWEGVLVVEGIETGDGRMFSENSITWLDPSTTVIALQRNIEESHGGETNTKAVLVGRITRIWRDEENPMMIRGAGVFDDNGDNGAEALRLVREGFLRGVSVDPDNIKEADVELVFPKSEEGSEEDELMQMFMAPETTIFHAGRLRAATLVNIPAFVEAQIWLTDPSTAGESTTVAPDRAVAAASSKPWNAGAQTRLAHMNPFASVREAFAVRGESHTQSRFLHHEISADGVVGEPNAAACRAAIRALASGRASYLTYQQRHAAYQHLRQHLEEAGEQVAPFVVDDVPGNALVAALDSLEGPPLEWFNSEEPDGFMAPVVTDEVTPNGWRRFMGHGAAWGTCHTSFPGACTEPPREGEHAYFRLGEVVTASGERVPVGSITMGTGHAATRGITAHQAAEHYDNTGSVVALVASVDGKHGIWLSGAIPPWVSAERVAALQAAGQLSGDWRKIGGKFRLVAFLTVNHPGFPVPRMKVGMTRGQQTSLVAAGLRPTTRQDRTPATLATMRRIAASIGRDSKSRAEEIRRRVKGV